MENINSYSYSYSYNPFSFNSHWPEYFVHWPFELLTTDLILVYSGNICQTPKPTFRSQKSCQKGNHTVIVCSMQKTLTTSDLFLFLEICLWYSILAIWYFCLSIPFLYLFLNLSEHSSSAIPDRSCHPKCHVMIRITLPQELLRSYPVQVSLNRGTLIIIS